MLTRTFHKRPSTVAYMARAFLRSPRREPPAFPPLKLVWKNAVLRPGEIAALQRLTGLDADHGLSLLTPHVFGFRLSMALLTDPAFPLPIWNALQIRNHIRQHAPIEASDFLDIETRVARQRVLPKGVEMDLATEVQADNRVVWESLVTFYYRGKFAEPGAPSPLAAPPEVNGEEISAWRAAGGSGWLFGRLTGDFNGIHWSNSYAKAFGFHRAFHHPQRVLGQCLAHLPASRHAFERRTLDVWLRGQIYYDADVSLRASRNQDDVVFAVYPRDETRPAIIARLSTT